MKKWKKILLWVVCGLVCTLLLTWIGVQAYFKTHKDEFVQKASSLASEFIEGDVTFSDLQLTLISSFPDLSLSLTDLTVRDTLYALHHKDLINLEEFEIHIEATSLLSSKIIVKLVSLKNGSIHLYQDESGRRSTSAFKKKTTKTGNTKKTQIQKVRLQNVICTFTDPDKTKTFDFHFKNTTASIDDRQESIKINVDLNALVNKFEFREAKGGFAGNKPISGRFGLTLQKHTKELTFENAKLYVDQIPMIFEGKFNLSGDKSYTLYITSKETPFRKASQLLPFSLSSKLENLDIDKPVLATAEIIGHLKPYDVPRSKVSWTVKESSVTTPEAIFNNASFTGYFLDQLVDTLSVSPENTILVFEDVNVTMDGIQITTPGITVQDFCEPFLRTHVKATTEAASLNQTLSLSTIDFISGKLTADLEYSGPLNNSTKTFYKINGKMNFENVSLEYIPRGILAKQFTGELIFKDKDVFLQQTSLNIDNNVVRLNVTGRNILGLINENTEHTLLEMNLYSPGLRLESFTKFIGKSKSRKRTNQRTRKMASIGSSIDEVLNNSTIHTNIRADQISYKKFNATNFTTRIELSKDVWKVDDTRLTFAEGQIEVVADIHNGQELDNPFELQATLSNVDISKALYAFNSFGINSIKPENIIGKLSSNIRINGKMNEDALLSPSSFKGEVDFSLKEGEIVNWDPIQNMAVFIFRNRDFSHVTFDEIRNTIQVNGELMTIDKMEVQSSVLSLYVRGIYDLQARHTDLTIQIPVSNLKTRNPGYVPQNTGKTKNLGLSVFVYARNDTEGDIAYSWGLFDKNKNNDFDTLSEPVKPKTKNTKKKTGNNKDQPIIETGTD